MDRREGMKVTGTAFDSVTPSVTANKESVGRNADVSREAHEIVVVLETTAGVEPMTALDASLKAQTYDLLTSKPMPDKEMTEELMMLKTFGDDDDITGTKENCVLEPTFPINAPVFVLRTVNEATPCGRLDNAGSWHVNCIDDTTVATDEVTDWPLLN
jgi:hypothetical protein